MVACISEFGAYPLKMSNDTMLKFWINAVQNSLLSSPESTGDPGLISNALRSLHDIGYDIREEDLLRLNGPDKYEQELILMAEVSAFFRVAYKRIIDYLPKSIDHDFLHGLKEGMQDALISGLGLDKPDNKEIAGSYFSEDLDITVRRVSLVQTKERLQAVTSKLSDFSISNNKNSRYLRMHLNHREFTLDTMQAQHLLKCAFPLIKLHGFSRKTLSLAALSLPTPHTTPLSDTAVTSLFGSGEDARRTLLSAWLEEGGDDMERCQEKAVSALLKHRLHWNKPVLHFLPEAFALMASPTSGIPPLDPRPAMQHAFSIADQACYLSGDESTGKTWYAKRMSISAAYIATELHQLSSPGTADGFLDEVLESAKNLESTFVRLAEMSPTFYDVSQPSSLLSVTSSSPSQATPSSTSRRSSLTVVVSLIGVLLVVSVTSGICVYIFRGRLFVLEPISKPKEAGTTGEDTCSADHASVLDIEIHQQSESEAPILRPLLLGAPSTASKKSPYKPFLLPQMQNGCYFQSYQAVSHSRTDTPKRRHKSLFTSPTVRQSFPFGKRISTLPPCKNSLTGTPSVFKASRSCPVGLHQTMAILPDLASRQVEKRDIDTPIKALRPVMRSSQSLLADQPDESIDSSSSEETDESLTRDYCDNDRVDKLSLAPQPALEGQVGDKQELSSNCASSEDYKECRAFTVEPENLSSMTFKTCARAAFSTLPLSKRPSHPIMRRKCSSFTISARLHDAKTSTIRPHKPSQENLPIRTSLLRDTRQITGPSKMVRSVELKQRMRQPFGTITNVIGTLNAKSYPPARPTLLLNDIPTDELERIDGTRRPPSLHLTNPPPNDPELLSVHWVPKPVVHPLTLTVLVKGNSAHPASYLSNSNLFSTTSSSRKARKNEYLEADAQTITVNTYAENTIADLRVAIEGVLGYRTYLRGMVHVGKRELFVPLLTERFFREWVKERMNEGRKGIIEAWRKDY
ncbi:hypothetical protein EW145_g5456 [Phellinidium pouzarii]|uniref:GED domain-containing protein n=1 Tax=Phellinidium pouzarii TaxID=167371 RepID=A0A4S4L024_9AGAM|nr:hypothetical protein EW145_g5456 [Phellinidium pouzarii]